MVTLYFVPQPGRFLAGERTHIDSPSLAVLRMVVKQNALAWVTA